MNEKALETIAESLASIANLLDARIENGEVRDPASGVSTPAVVFYSPRLDPFEGGVYDIDGELCRIMGYALDSTGEWHPVTQEAELSGNDSPITRWGWIQRP